LALSANGQYLAAACTDFLIYVYDLNARRLINDLQGHNEFVTCVAFSPDAQFLLSGSEDRTVNVYRLTGRSVRKIKEHPSAVWWVAWAPDGQTFYSSSSDRTIRQWDAATLKGMQRYAEHKAPVRNVRVSEHGDRLVSVGDDRTIRIWDTESAKHVKIELPYGVMTMALGPQSMAWTSFDSTVRMAPSEPYLTQLAAL
jgi:WD40 repeat protein